MIEKTHKVGIWLDHVHARIIYPNGIIEPVKSMHETNLRIAGEQPDGIRMGNHRSSNNEYSKHHIEIEELHRFFAAIYHSIKNFDQIFLFGPGTATEEFRNYLIEKEKRHLTSILIRRTEQMTDAELTEAVFVD
ncbi:MAG: hypothetical protein IPP51_16450 [Bacteroidetes bacterium]|nr:hypothetical protein [Bacteroidota bacterium]